MCLSRNIILTVISCLARGRSVDVGDQYDVDCTQRIKGQC